MAQEAYDLAPYSPAAQFEYAVSKMSVGKPEESVPVIKALVERFPNSEKAMELLAQAYNQTGDAEALEATLGDIMQRFSETVIARVALARIHLKNKDFDAAKKLASELVQSEQGQADGYALLGDISFSQNAIPEALVAYQKAHEETPTTQSLLKLYAAHQQTSGGLGMLDGWLVEHDDDVPVRITKAIADISTGRESEAISQYKKVLEIMPEHIVALNNLAWIFDQRKDEQAIEYAQRAYEAAPNRAEIADTYGWIMLRKGSTQQVVELLSKATDGAPDNANIRYHYASALVESGDDNGAIRELETVLHNEAIFPSRAEVITLLDELRQ